MAILHNSYFYSWRCSASRCKYCIFCVVVMSSRLQITTRLHFFFTFYDERWREIASVVICSNANTVCITTDLSNWNNTAVYSCWLCHYEPMTKSTAMTSELIMAKQFNMWSLIAFETLALSFSLSLWRSLYLQRWVTQQQVLGEPWRVLSFCHLYDKLPRQWTWRAGTLIQFQLLTLGIRLHAFAGLRKGDSPPRKRKKKREEEKKKDNLNTVKQNER